ncbi:hypothetical protein BDZ45DRAFT_805645 [Acephala macrosclerotiorum]|nr:hypothetical protein BDZ45DRAFT_805645 [Acephala macrosclerotiorum]
MTRYPSSLFTDSDILDMDKSNQVLQLFEELPDPNQRLYIQFDIFEMYQYQYKLPQRLLKELPDPNQQLYIQVDSLTLYGSFRVLRLFKELSTLNRWLESQFEILDVYLSYQALQLFKNLPDPYQHLSQLNILETYKSRQATQLFKHLPDPNQQIYIQLDRNLNTSTFTHFLKLPPELQLMIWRRCLRLLKPRSIMDCSPLERRRRERRCRHERTYPLPAMLHVCYTSRMLTLRRYSVVFWKDLEDLPAWIRDRRRPICFDHERDLLYVLCGRQQGHLSFSDWMARLNHFCGGRLADVKRFEIRQVHVNFWHSELTWVRQHVTNGNSQWTWPMTRLSEPALDGLFQLPELQVVNFPELKCWDVRILYWELITEYLGIHRARLKNREAPTVLVRRRFLPSQ